MQTRTKTIVRYATLVILTIIGAICLVVAIPRLPCWATKQAEWAGALGTIAAFFATIWLATSETRKRRRDDLMRARLRAAGMMLRVEHARRTADELRDKLHTVAAAMGMGISSEIIAYGDDLLNSDFWSLDEVEALIPLPNSTAVLLAQSGDELASVKREFEKARAGGVLVSEDSRRSFAITQHDSLAGVLERLDKCLVECARAKDHLQRSGPGA